MLNETIQFLEESWFVSCHQQGQTQQDVSAYTLCVGAAENSIEAVEKNLWLGFTNRSFFYMDVF